MDSAQASASLVTGGCFSVERILAPMTQQYAALVEESAAAAESLKSQAGQLSVAVQVFKMAPA